MRLNAYLNRIYDLLYSEISSHPHHKHIGGQRGEQIEAAQPPSLTEVLREIEDHLYPAR